MKVSILSCALLLAAATVAEAAGVSLAWNNCAADGGVQNLAFACDSNEGSRSLVGSFVVDSDLHNVNGNELIVLLASAGATFPAWWRFRTPGSCRQTALAIAAHNGSSCPDPFLGNASMNIAAYQLEVFGQTNTARLLCVNAVMVTDVVTLLPGREYGVARWTISNTKTVGAPSCAGCETPVCIVFDSANLTTEGGLSDTKLTSEAAPGSNFVTWQGGAGTNCPAALPTRNATWGSVKSLYR